MFTAIYTGQVAVNEYCPSVVPCSGTPGHTSERLPLSLGATPTIFCFSNPSPQQTMQQIAEALLLPLVSSPHIQWDRLRVSCGQGLRALRVTDTKLWSTALISPKGPACCY
jgi:hypothetical protein